MPRLAIKEMLRKRKMSQYALALAMGMDLKNVARLFRPGFNPKFDMLVRIAKALRCRVRDLIKE